VISVPFASDCRALVMPLPASLTIPSSARRREAPILNRHNLEIGPRYRAASEATAFERM
jgi:hypothetical protein